MKKLLVEGYKKAKYGHKTRNAYMALVSFYVQGLEPRRPGEQEENVIVTALK